MRYWLSFDLGLRGNYESLYEWLDAIEAKECGDNIATFITTKTRDQIKEELSKILDEKARIYLIDRKKGGQFIFGKRKVAAPWAGYGEAMVEVEQEV
ncbi:hypothetical protein METP2_02874 [Methanosarcinales archaeon]|nr:hypothetical protein [Candidatus Methanoperedens sp. BLZ2]KAB2946642.1 MAG: hypothetical protein F9K14_07235 [Candidatus Methanoperedens sp.]MBZ0173979.1 hypothetical protein [Candidatus Methanoperedens nitroreducens]CAG0995272.1 hypothetical protein METP2_02874 [Methanosarcinales archaeon]MCX9078918.1 hypothetical protein [Candidatus Methanoperedens sp.]MCX9088980.1 hypothetical protein [Candidatus Methanoperedens sp.]